MDWNVIKNQDDINFLLEKFHNFHDSCLVSSRYISGACVDKNTLEMNPINTERSLSMIFQSQFDDCYSIELLFNGLVKMNLEPCGLNYDCIIFKASFQKENDKFFWSDSPECSSLMPEGTWVISEKALWRVLK